MGRRRRGRDLTVKVAIAAEPMTPEELEAAETMVARLLARAYLADNPHLLPRQQQAAQDSGNAGPLPTARAEVATPTTSGSGPAKSEIGERYDGESQREH